MSILKNLFIESTLKSSDESFCPYRAKRSSLIITQGAALGYELTVLTRLFQADSLFERGNFSNVNRITNYLSTHKLNNKQPVY